MILDTTVTIDWSSFFLGLIAAPVVAILIAAVYAVSQRKK